jgi:hypothetical protein
MILKKNLVSLIIFATCYLSTSTGYSQVAVIDYVKVTPDKLGEYLSLEEQWKVIHEARLNKGLIISWGLYEVMFTGSADLYNYATVTVYDNLDMYDKSWDITFLTESYPDMNDEEIEAFYTRTWQTKNLVRNVVLHRMHSTSTDPGQLPTYVIVNGMKVIPGHEVDYVDMESNIFMPIHEEGIRQKFRAGWSLWEKFYGGDYSDYQYMTFDAYYSFKQIENDITAPLYEKLNPRGDFNQVLAKANGIRTIVTREVWRLIEFVERNDDQ